MTNEITMPSNVLPEFIGIILLLVISISIIMPGIDRASRLFFLAFFGVLILNTAIFIIDMVTYKDPELITFSKWLPLVEYLLLFLPALILMVYQVHTYGEKRKESILFRVSFSLWGLFVIMLFIGHFTEIFYYTLPDGSFYLTRWTPLLFLPLISILTVNLISLIRKRNKLSKRYFYAFFSCILLMMISMLIHAFFFTTLILNIAMALGSLIMYILILTDQIDQHIRQKTMIANQNANIMVLQMRPHFIYNTMTSIYYLCEQNPKKAQQVILDFTTYLRRNFNAIASTETIPFSNELEHVRAFLSVEIVQFEDNLSVTYDIPHTRFRLPALTLQPLVENAVKYGMDPDAAPLEIIIQTRETDQGSVITVKNTGPAFDPENAFRQNGALANIRQRLSMMCHGSISIESTESKGTVVTVIIPPNKY